MANSEHERNAQNAEIERLKAEMRPTATINLNSGMPVTPITPEEKQRRERAAREVSVDTVHAEMTPMNLPSWRAQSEQRAADVAAAAADIAASRHITAFTSGGPNDAEHLARAVEADAAKRTPTPLDELNAKMARRAGNKFNG
jgi:hypothetical protein